MTPLLFGLLLLLPGSVAGQLVSVNVTDAETANPLDVSFVVLLDDEGQRQATGLTGPNGWAELRAPQPGIYQVRVERLGYESITSAALNLTRGGVLQLELRMPAHALELEGIEVEADTRCRVRPAQGELAATLWEEARKALAVATWAQEAKVLRFRTVTWRRALDPETLRILDETRTRHRSYHSGSPYASLPAAELQSEGYVQQDENGDLVYYAPDPAVLLSDAFLDAHCFVPRLDDPPEEGWVGLAFRPVRVGDLPEIEGTFWLDAAAAELERIEYAYTHLPEDLHSQRPGGTLELDRIDEGPWIVQRWAIRTPVVQLRARTDVHGRNRRREPYLAGLNETGGEVLAIRTSEGSPLRRVDGSILKGAVWDSVAGAPLVGATVRLVGTNLSANTDTTGSFRMDERPGGAYEVAFTHPRLRSLQWSPAPQPIDLTPGDSLTVNLALPPADSLLDAVCPVQWPTSPLEQAARPDGPDRTAVVGRVSEAAVSGEAPGATALPVSLEVGVSWNVSRVRDKGRRAGGAVQVERVRRALTVSPASDGTFRVCGLPADEEVEITVMVEGREVGDVLRVRLSPGEIRHVVLERTLAAPDETAGVAVSASVRDVETGEFLADVFLRIDDSPWVATGASGRVALGRVPSGRHRLELRHIMVGDWSDTVLVRAPGPRHWLIDLVPRAIELEGLEVTVRARDGLDRDEAGVRRDRMTRDDIDARLERGASDVTDLMRSQELPFVDIRHGTVMTGAGVDVPGVCVELARKRGLRCAMVAVYVDGVPLHDPQLYLFTINPHAVESIEVLQPNEATFRFGTEGGYNGAILIQTRRGGG
jgi:hypothetical protein